MQYRNSEPSYGLIADLKSGSTYSQIAVLLTILVTGFAIPSNLRAQSGPRSQVRAVRLSDVEGSVQILSGDQTEFKQAYANMPVLEGYRVETGDEGRAEIQFEDGSVARLTPNSSLNLNQLSRNSDGTTVNQIEVLSGLTYFEAGAKQHYSILFGHNVITPNEQSTFRLNLDANPAELVVLHGSVQTSNTNAYSVNVRDGETVRFDAEDARYFLAAGAMPDSWDQWNLDRDQALASLASEQTAISGADSSSAGWSDLDHYGDWYAVPQYGNVWAPRGVDAGWDPYGVGYWAYYPGYGYVWVSSNPWGWLPYRCGAWNYFDSFGWGWIPGGCGGYQWFTDVVIWDAPSYYRRPQHPHPVGPRDNLPHHGTILAVNRGGGGITPGGNFVGSKSTAGGPPRILQVGGHAVAPLPKTMQPSRILEIAGPKSTVQAPASGTDERPRPMTQYGNGKVTPGERGGYQPQPASGSRAIDRPSYRSSPEVIAPRTSAPVYEAPRNVAPRSEPSRSEPARSEAPRYQAPRVEAPRYEAPRSEAPRAEAPRSSPPPAAPSSPSPAPAPAKGK